MPEELLEFVNEFGPTGEDIDSEVFFPLPAEIQVEIVRDLMYQNEMTQGAPQVTGVAGSSSSKNVETVLLGRIADEGSCEYILVKNEIVQEWLGWELPRVTSSSADTTAQSKKDDNDDDGDCIYYEDPVMDNDAEEYSGAGRWVVGHFAGADSGYYYGGYGAGGHSCYSYYLVQQAIGQKYYGAKEAQTATPSSYYEDEQGEYYYDDDNETMLNAEDFYNLWFSRTPRCIYQHALS